MALLKKFVHVFSLISYFFIILYAVVCIPNIFSLKPLIVLTDSMEPIFKPGTIIYYEKVKQSDIKINNIITFKNNNKLISHRVYDIKDNKYITKGDNNEVCDPEMVIYSNIVGKVNEFHIPYLGYYIMFINHNNYLIIVVVIILILEFLLSNMIKTNK